MGALNSESAMTGEASQGLLVTATQFFEGDRAAVRRQAAAFALDHAMSLLQRSLSASPPSV
jgi:nicotinamide mononucleotide (NMN) deamidase PncC